MVRVGVGALRRLEREQPGAIEGEDDETEHRTDERADRSEARAAFAGQGRRHGYRAGTVLFLQGDPPDDVYCILSGRIEITSAAADGRARLLAIAAPGDLLGELGVLGRMPRSGTATCVADTTACVVDGQRFVRFLTDQPSAALAPLSILARQVVTQDWLVDDLLFLDLKGRVVKRLLGLASRPASRPSVAGHGPVSTASSPTSTAGG